MIKQQQLVREARWALWLSLVYLVGWSIFAYFTPAGRGIFGFPLWFELSCIFLPLVFTLLVVFMIKKVYREVDLEDNRDE